MILDFRFNGGRATCVRQLWNMLHRNLPSIQVSSLHPCGHRDRDNDDNIAPSPFRILIFLLYAGSYENIVLHE
jgi:hypothetical protein